MKNLVVGAMLTVVPLVASATDWYVLNGQNQECLSSKQASAKSGVSLTPLAVRNFFREHPSFGYTGYKVFRNKYGRSVLLLYRGGKDTMLFFSDEAMCQNFRQYLVHSGQGLNQLK